ncbi:DUF4177 domain-containing protein [Chloroflexota bacterium]
MTNRKQTPDVLAEMLEAELDDYVIGEEVIKASSKPARKSSRRVRQTKPLSWEYIIVTFQDYKGWRPRFENGLEYKDWMNLPLMHVYINDLGAEGWELVSASASERMFGSADKYHAYFKRKGQ